MVTLKRAFLLSLLSKLSPSWINRHTLTEVRTDGDCDLIVWASHRSYQSIVEDLSYHLNTVLIQNIRN